MRRLLTFSALAPALFLSLSLSSLIGCSATVDADGPAEATALLDDGAKADALGANLSTQAGQLKVTVDPALTVTPIGQGFRYTVSGSTNRDLDGIQSFVPDDAFGEALLTGKRTFTVSLNDDHEINSVLSGMRLLVSFTVHGSTTSYTAGLLFAPRFAPRSGPSQIGVDTTVGAIWYAGQLAYRGKLRFTVTPSVVNGWTDQDLGPRISQSSARIYQDDWSFEGLKSGLVAGPVHFSIVDGAGKAYFRDADVRLVVKELALTTLDPYERWPQPTCAATVQRCLDKLPYGSADTASCGRYDQVRVCRVTQILPAFLPADGGSEIPAVVDGANQSLTPPRHVTAAVYRYDWSAVTPPAIRQILDGYVAFDRLDSVTVAGAAPRSELDAALAAWHLDGLTAALEHLVFIDRFEVGKITSGSTTWYVLHVPEAGIILVVTLQTT
ncbi:MAG: hypothetical protein JWN44_1327 [Myxococcales bacterium]|nr:hypothetical protein [Myxococcales bacterium]